MNEEPRQKKLQLIQGANPEDETCQTFVLHNEDHTLGNALRYMIIKNADVQFCGYSVPHPSESKINLRIQTHGEPSTTILKKGLKDLCSLCDHVLNTFEASVAEYKQRHSGSDVEME